MKEYENLLKKEVFDKAEEIDPSGEQDWYSMCLGWSLAKGMNPDDAHEFAIHIRYKTKLG